MRKLQDFSTKNPGAEWSMGDKQPGPNNNTMGLKHLVHNIAEPQNFMDE